MPPTLFLASLDKAGPKHSTSVPFSARVAVPLSVEKKEVALVPNPVRGVAVKVLSGPQVDVAPAVLCDRIHSLLPPTLQIVTPSLFPVTVHLKVKVSPGQVGGAGMNCPATLPGKNTARQVTRHVRRGKCNQVIFMTYIYMCRCTNKSTIITWKSKHVRGMHISNLTCTLVMHKLKLHSIYQIIFMSENVVKC